MTTWKNVDFENQGKEKKTENVCACVHCLKYSKEALSMS